MRALFVMLLLAVSLPVAARRGPDPGPLFAAQPGYERFVQGLADTLSLDRQQLDHLFRQVHIKPQILRAISLPAEARPWDQYRPLFFNEARIQGGVAFWEGHADALARARETYGVPEAVIVAILGVETQYGRNMGGWRVLDALTTLAVAYPPRADYFRRELTEFLLFTREQGVDALTVKGSYAGAMGLGQFMPSSCRKYGVDFDGDGHADLWRNPVDAIGSVAHYLQAFGWQPGGRVVVPVEVAGEATRELANTGWSTRKTVAEWRRLGVNQATPLPEDEQAMLVRLDTTSGPEFWLAFQNYYVITRYNRSFQYALAVYQLASAIAASRFTACGADPC
ncbi:lytic murein transglycosylase B [Thiobacter aerophilum]|uniref:Lytic murein transglycosylase B n=1 Tax=Thiobacter aerophilum TaxID=3121275 RepID=A0ABV0EEG6_9BURK